MASGTGRPSGPSDALPDSYTSSHTSLTTQSGATKVSAHGIDAGLSVIIGDAEPLIEVARLVGVDRLQANSVRKRDLPSQARPGSRCRRLRARLAAHRP